MSALRRGYPSDVSDAEWEFVFPRLISADEDVSQREHDLRQLWNALRYVVRTGCPGDYLPRDFPIAAEVGRHARCWRQAGVFEEIPRDLRILLGFLGDVHVRPSATSPNGLVPTAETLGQCLARKVTPADERLRVWVNALALRIQNLTERTVSWAYIDPSCTGVTEAQEIVGGEVRWRVLPNAETQRGFLWVPNSWMVENAKVCRDRIRRMTRNYERFGETLSTADFEDFA